MPTTAPSWHKVTYTNDEGIEIETAPTIPFPGPPAPTAGGSWPKIALRAEPGLVDEPTVERRFWDPILQTQFCGGICDDEDGNPNGPSGEDYSQADVICPTKTSSTKQLDELTESPLEEGRPIDNIRSYYNRGQRASNAQMANTARSACRALGTDGTILGNRLIGINTYWERNEELPHNGNYAIHIRTRLTLKPGCQFSIDYDQCQHYFGVRDR